MALHSHWNREGYTVSKVIDGDTVHAVNAQGHHIKIRLLHIDAPEISQNFGKDSKEHLSNKILGHNIVVDETKPDHRYPDRTLGVIHLDGRNINLEMVQEGYAWHYAQFSHVIMYEEAEKHAREQHLGLWRTKNPTPPWEYRKEKMLERLQKP